VNSEYFWWLAALALVAAGGLLAVVSWRPSADEQADAGWDDEQDGGGRRPDEPADVRPT
jgi:hypothetical protein